MIVNDRRIPSLVAVGIFSLALFGFAGPVRAADSDAVTPALSEAQASPAAPMSFVTIVREGVDYTYSTHVRSVGAFLAERDVRIGTADAIVPGPGEPIVDGMKIVYREAVPVTLTVNRRTLVVRTAATTVRDFLAAQRVRIGAHDEVSPPLDGSVAAHDSVRVVHVATWTARVRQHFAQKVRNRTDALLPLGRTTTVEPGHAGLREMTYRFVKRGSDAPLRTTLAARIVREPQTRIIAHGVAAYASFARVAEQGFASAVHFAGAALHMIATAYTGGCYGCSGVTASGTRAGFGVIAVDPHVIPLGTKLFVRGYGRAVAGDTGSAILGNRIDLGMNSQQDAMRFGRRAVTVYVLR